MIKSITFIVLLLTISCRLLLAQTTLNLADLKAKYEADKRNIKVASNYVEALRKAKLLKEAEMVAREYMSRCPVVQLEDRDTYLLITPYLFEDVYSNSFEYAISLMKKMCWERDEVAENTKQPAWERRLRALQTGVSGDGEIDKRYEVLALLSKNLAKEVNLLCHPIQKEGSYTLPKYEAQKMAHVKKLVNKGEFLGKDGMLLKLSVMEALQLQQYQRAMRELCVGAELNLTHIRGTYLIEMLHVMLNYPLKQEEVKEAITTISEFMKRETERGGGLNYYTVLGLLYEKDGDREQAEKYIRLGEVLERERMERYQKMMNH